MTGAAGFVGSHLVEALRESGDEVVALDCFTDYYDPARKEENASGFEVLRLDLARDPLEPALDGVDGVFHLAGQPGVRASFGAGFGVYLERNLLATQRLFEACAARGLRVAFASSSSVYGDAEAYPTAEDTPPRPISPYGITKLACEHLVRATRVDAVSLRYFTVFGPRQRPDMAFARVVAALAEGRPFEVYGDGAQSRDFTYVADIVAATRLALAAGERGAVYNVGGGAETTLAEAIAILERHADRRLDLVHRPAAAGDVRRTAADTTRIRAELGWRPRVSLEDGLAAEWRWAEGRVGAR